MKKSVRAVAALAGLILACGLALTGCSGLLEVESEKSDSSKSSTSLNSRATYVGSSGISGTPSGSGSGSGFVSAKGWLNSAYVIWTASGSSFTVTCDGTAVDSLLTRKIGNQWRVDIPGLKAGSHTIKITGSATITATVNVVNHDRSGFAFYGSTVPGAYNADGTLKSGAKVFHCNNSTVNTIKMDVVTSSKGATTSCTGMQEILNALKKGYDSTPVCFRIIGLVKTPSVNDAGDIMISGSGSSKLLANGITIEGVGSDATAYGWGIRIKNAQYVEVSNLGFMMCNSSEGDNIWVHNCDMFYGQPGGDADQKKGDGALDCKKSTYVTFDYNHFWDSGKCNLLGLSEGTTSDLYITYHHNWYDHSDSRHPRVRYYSAHVYNNYYDGCAKYGAGACLGSSIFMESNYFRNTKYPMMISMQGTDLYAGTKTKSNDNATFSKEAGGMIKAYGNKMAGTYYFVSYGQSSPYHGGSSTTDFDAYVVSSKSATVPSSVKSASGGNTYNNFDTSSIMYSYTADSADNVVSKVTTYAGRVEGGDFQYSFSSSSDTSYDVDNTLKSKLQSYTGATTATNTAQTSSSSGGNSDTSGGSSSSSSGSSSSGSSSGSSSSGSSSSGSSSSGSSSSGSSSSGSSSSGSASAVSLKAESYSTGTLTSNTTYGSFTVLANSSKTVKIASSSLSYNSNC